MPYWPWFQGTLSKQKERIIGFSAPCATLCHMCLNPQPTSYEVALPSYEGEAITWPLTGQLHLIQAQQSVARDDRGASFQSHNRARLSLLVRGWQRSSS